MKNVVSCEFMRKCESEYFASGVQSSEVMYRAGNEMAKHIAAVCPENGKILIVCGGGNNGGDGFVAAWVLDAQGYDVSVCFVGDNLTPDSSIYYEKCRHLLGELCPADVILDAVFGTGFHGELTGKALDAVNFINKSDALVISADIPSGLPGDAPCNTEFAVRADVTLCVQAAKPNCVCGSGSRFAGKTVVIDAGIPNCESNVKLIFQHDINAFLPQRDPFGHKNTFGSVAIVGGCDGMEGAAMLSAMAAAKSGGGKVSIVSALPYYGQRPPYIMQKTTLDGFDAIAFGMGAEISAQTQNAAKEILKKDCHVVLDADALTTDLKEARSIIMKKKERGYVTLLTPHVGEAARLLGCTNQVISSDPIKAAMYINNLYGCSVILKSWYTVVNHNGMTYVLNHPQSVLAKAGSGDCLAGICASVLAVGGHPAGAVLLHSRAGSAAAEKYGSGSATASDVINCIRL